MDFFIIFYILYVIILAIVKGPHVKGLVIGNLFQIMLISISKPDLINLTTTLFIAALTILLAVVYTDPAETILYQLTIIGIVLLPSSNLMTIFLALEVVNFISISLIPLQRMNIYALESALKYFLTSAVSAALFVLGSAILYGETGSLDLAFQASLSSNQLLGPLLIIISLFIKLGIAPFHIWMPDAYEGAAMKTFIFISLFPKIFLLYILYTIHQTFNIPPSIFYAAIAACGLIGGVSAIFQQKTKRFLAFTMILNNIFLIIAIVASNLLYLATTFLLYFVNNFLTLSLMLNQQIKNLRDLLVLNKTTSLIFALSLFSALGLPPLIGFFTKAIPFFALINNPATLIIAVSFAVLSAFYYLRLVSVNEFAKKPIMRFNKAISWSTATLSGALSIFSIFFLAIIL